MPPHFTSNSRLRPSFTIYRDDPQPLEEQPTITSPRLPSTTKPISQTFSIKDKENSNPYGGSSIKVKSVKSPTNRKSHSGPSTSITKNTPSSPPVENIRTALATKFLSDSRSGTRLSKPKSKATVEAPSSRGPSSDCHMMPRSTMQRPKLKKTSSTTSTSTTSYYNLLGSLTSVTEAHHNTADRTAICGKDGLTLADHRAIELTQTPLADISAAYPTSQPPDTYLPSLPRKRSRALTLQSQTIDPVAILQSASSDSTTPQKGAQEIQAKAIPNPQRSSSSSPVVASSPSSPHKRLRLSPKSSLSPLESPPATLGESSLSEEQEVELQLKSED